MYTKEFLSLTGPLPLFAIGRKSEVTLTEAGFSVTGLRHPEGSTEKVSFCTNPALLCRAGF